MTRDTIVVCMKRCLLVRKTLHMCMMIISWHDVAQWKVKGRKKLLGSELSGRLKALKR